MLLLEPTDSVVSLPTYATFKCELLLWTRKSARNWSREGDNSASCMAEISPIFGLSAAGVFNDDAEDPSTQ